MRTRSVKVYRVAAIRALAKLANGKTHFGSALPTTSSQSNHAGQVRGYRWHRQGAQAQQHEPHLLALRRDRLRRAPAEQETSTTSRATSVARSSSTEL